MRVDYRIVDAIMEANDAYTDDAIESLIHAVQIRQRFGQAIDKIAAELATEFSADLVFFAIKAVAILNA